MTDYYISPRWTGEFNDCSMPMTFDQYSNCAFGCLYCFSNYQRGVGSRKYSYYRKDVKAVNVAHIKKMFLEPESSDFGVYIKNRMPMQWGGLSDPFCGFERKHGVGLELLRFFKDIKYPICFSTKGTWWLDRTEYTELFKDTPFWNVKVTIINLDDEKSHKIERGTPPPSERLQAIEKIAKLNCGGATLRLRPFMIGISNPDHRLLIAEGMDHFAAINFTKAGINLGDRRKSVRFHGFTIKDYMRWLWNNPEAGQSPYRQFEGIMKPDHLDTDGDIVYIYDERYS